jgi:hypothetical protein
VAAGLGVRVRTGWAAVGAASLVDAGTRLQVQGPRVATASATVQVTLRLAQHLPSGRSPRPSIANWQARGLESREWCDSDDVLGGWSGDDLLDGGAGTDDFGRRD